MDLLLSLGCIHERRRVKGTWLLPQPLPKCEMQGLLQLWSSWNRNRYNPSISIKFPCLWILHRNQNRKCVRNLNYSTSRTDGQLHPSSILIHRQVCEAFLHSQFIATVSYFLANNQPTSWFCKAKGSSLVGTSWVAGSIQSTMAACLTSIQDCSSPCQCKHFTFHLSYAGTGCLIQSIITWQITARFPTGNFPPHSIRKVSIVNIYIYFCYGWKCEAAF